MFGALFDMEGQVSDTITSALEKFQEETQLPFEKLFILIRLSKPDEDGERKPVFVLCTPSPEGKPSVIRTVTLKEILG